jgi:conflict system pore-forming effector with SLATT domain
MAIREATTSVEDPTPAGQRPPGRWWRRRRDLRARPFPTAAMEQWQDTEAALVLLYRYAEARAIDAADWYLQDKWAKRIWSRGLRLLVILLVSAGGLQPLLDAAAPGAGPGSAAWGYVLLALAAACIGLDRFFGISSGWMRSMTTAQALEHRLEQLQYDWAAECARSAARTVDPKQVQTRLALLRAFSDDVAALMQQETAEWVLEFQRSLLRLEASSGGAGAWPAPRGRAAAGREGDGSRVPAGEGPPAPPAGPPGR